MPRASVLWAALRQPARICTLICSAPLLARYGAGVVRVVRSGSDGSDVRKT